MSRNFGRGNFFLYNYNLRNIVLFFSLQYDNHLTELEKKISLVQERALEQAEMDLGADDENYTIAEPDSREVRIFILN